MKRQVKRKHFNAISIAVIIVAAAIYAFFRSGITGTIFPSYDVQFHFIDVGQGDAAMIRTNEKTVVIDAGPGSSADILCAYIKNYTSKIDCLVLSHAHEDHMGGAFELINSIEVDMIIMSEDASDSAFFGRTIDAIAKNDIELNEALPGDNYEIGDITLELFAPQKDYGDKNNNSVVLRAQADGASVLFTGDAESESENDIIDKYGERIKSNILKVGHHGSSTSTTEKFLSAAAPDIAVISCARGNSYGHPHQEIIRRLRAYGIEILRTDEHGNIVISYKDGEVYVY